MKLSPGYSDLKGGGGLFHQMQFVDYINQSMVSNKRLGSGSSSFPLLCPFWDFRNAMVTKPCLSKSLVEILGSC